MSAKRLDEMGAPNSNSDSEEGEMMRRRAARVRATEDDERVIKTTAMPKRPLGVNVDNPSDTAPNSAKAKVAVANHTAGSRVVKKATTMKARTGSVSKKTAARTTASKDIRAIEKENESAKPGTIPADSAVHHQNTPNRPISAEVASAKSAREQLRPRRNRFWTTKRRIIKYGLRNFTRNAWLTTAATAVMTVTLLIVFVTALASTVLHSAVDDIKSKIDISIYLSPKASDETAEELATKLQLLNQNATDVSVETKQKAYQTMLDATTDTELKKILQENEASTKARFYAILHVKVADLSKIDELQKTVEGNADFKKWLNERTPPSYASDRRQSIDTINNWAATAQRAGLIGAAVFLVISMLVVFNTIRMAIFSRRDEIEMMKLIGAERKFIRGPFLVEAEIYGLVAGLLASGIGYLALSLVRPALENFASAEVMKPIYDLAFGWAWAVTIGLVLIGMIVGYISARLAVRKYLRF